MARPRRWYGPDYRRSVKPPKQEKAVCRSSETCKDCPFPASGFVCWGYGNACIEIVLSVVECAHGERLFSYQTRNDIPDTDLHLKLGIPKNGTQYTLGKRDLFAVVIAFRYLLPNDDFKRFKASLTSVIQHYLKSSGAMTEENLYQYMGFPSNWSKITAYKK